MIRSGLFGGSEERLRLPSSFGSVPPNHFGYDPDTLAYPYDPQKAQKLLAEAGYEDGLTLTFDRFEPPQHVSRVAREAAVHAGRSMVWEGYESEQINALIRQAEATVSNADRHAIYRQIFSVVRDDAPWILLYNPTNYWAVGPGLKDWSPSSDGWILLD